MKYIIGDLVHVPQAVKLIECDAESLGNHQLTIPLRFRETEKPEVGIVTEPRRDGYVKIYCKGNYWSVKADRIYTLNSKEIV